MQNSISNGTGKYIYYRDRVKTEFLEIIAEDNPPKGRTTFPRKETVNTISCLYHFNIEHTLGKLI